MFIQKLDAVRSSLVRFNQLFTHARALHTELAPFATPAEVAAALDATSSYSPEDRYAIVSALVAEHQRLPSPLWGSLLLVAFTPMLVRLRKRMRRPDDEDRDGRVLVAFLNAVSRLREKDRGIYTTAALQRETQRALVRQGEVEQSEPELVSFNEDVHTPHDPFAVTLGEACADAAWSDARARKLASLTPRRRRRAQVRALPDSRRSAA